MADISEWEALPRDLCEAIPAPLFRGLDNYVRYHIETGSFLRAVLENDLIQAMLLAHRSSLAALPFLVQLLGFAPARCYGSPAKVELWLSERDREGESG